MPFLFSQKKEESPKAATQHLQSGWRSSYLRKKVLATFVLAFSAIIVVLEVLYKSSQAHHGIAASNQSRHYLWTYGPTAILTVLAALWSRVEFQAKQSAPWLAMYEGPQPAERSILLDYISDMQPVAIWKALKHRHFAVASSVTCSILLRILIILSTSLFSLQQTKVHKENTPVQLHDDFSTQGSTLDTVGSQPYDILNGIIYKNVTYPIGTNINLTFQEFSAPSAPSGALITAPIDGLMADLDCETATIDEKSLHYRQSKKTNAYEDNAFQFHIASQSCNITHSAALIASGYQPKAYFQGGNCERGIGPSGYRIMLTLVEAYQKQTTPAKPPENHLHDDSGDWQTVHLGLNKSIALICKPSLSLLNLEAKMNTTQSLSDVSIRRIGVQADGLPGISATEIAKIAVNNSTLTTGFRPVEYETPYEEDAHVDVEFTLGMNLIGKNATIDNLWDEGALENSAKAYYRAITAQIMHMGLVQHQESKTLGSSVVDEDRVVMTEPPMRGMEACLGISILLGIYLAFIIPSTSTATWNPNYISAIAAITAKSSEFRSYIRGAGVIGNDKLQARLEGKLYYSQITPKSTSIELTEHHRHHTDQYQLDPSSETEYVAWRPFPGIIGRIVIFVLISLAVATLEALLQISEKNDGLGDAISTRKDLHYLWTILPALAMVGISLLLGSIDFNIRCLAPYAPLVEPNGAFFDRSMNLSFLDSLGLINGFRSVTSRHFAVQATTLATAAAFFLTIVTSGLYSVVEIPYHTNVNFTQVGGFPDPRTIAGAQLNMDETGETAGILTAEYILGYNLTFPSWSYEEFALAKVAMMRLPDGETANGTFVDLLIPALRLAPVCKIQTAADLQPLLSDSVSNSAGSYQLWANQTTLGCPGTQSDSYINSSVSVWKDIGSEPFGYSTQAECHTGPGNKDVFAASSHYVESYIWGFLNGSSIQHIMGMSCIQYAEVVDLSTRLRLPELEIDEDSPPFPVESSAKLASDLYVPIPEWWVLNANGKYPKFDGFFQLLTSGKYAIPIENFESAEHDQKVIDAIKYQHKIISAQQMSNYTRGTANNTIEHAPILANITTSNRQRVVQDIVSTRILEGLLGFILVLGIFGSVLLNTDHVLPKNPCSIAAVASLLADSKLLNEVENGTWDPNDKRARQTFAQYKFHLGWWLDDLRAPDEAERQWFTIDHVSKDTEPEKGTSFWQKFRSCCPKNISQKEI